VKNRLFRILLAVFVISLTVGAAIPAEANTIDLPWNTFLGGDGNDVGWNFAVDSSCNVYVTGESSSTWGNPIRPYAGSPDALVVKLDSSGDILWNTFLGGTDADSIYGTAVDSSGSVYVVGSSWATWGSPIRAFASGRDSDNNVCDDAFVAKLDSSGNLLWNTFLGGNGYDGGNGIAVDSSGNVYISGGSNTTWGNPVMAYSSDSDPFAAKLNSDGVLQWNTFLGGKGGDSCKGIAVDSSGNCYVIGTYRPGYGDDIWGSPVRAYTGDTDAFAAKLDSNGVLRWNTFLGGTYNDWGTGISVDSSDNVYVTGSSIATWGSPVRAYTGDTDAFAAKLDSSGGLLWNTFLGGPSSDGGSGIAVYSSGNVYVAGNSRATWGNPVRTHNGGDFFNAFAAKLNNSGVLQWNTFLGGTLWDISHGIAVDSSENVYVVGESWATWGNPIRAFTPTNDINGNAYRDAFVAKLDSSGSLDTPVIPPVPELPAGVLLLAGITGIGAFILIRRKKATSSMA